MLQKYGALTRDSQARDSLTETTVGPMPLLTVVGLLICCYLSITRRIRAFEERRKKMGGQTRGGQPTRVKGGAGESDDESDVSIDVNVEAGAKPRAGGRKPSSNF